MSRPLYTPTPAPIEGTNQRFVESERSLSHEERASRETGKPVQHITAERYRQLLREQRAGCVLKRPSCNPDMEFTPLTDEQYREYVFPTPHGDRTVRINQPQALNVSKSGTHRVIDQQGVCHIMPSGWLTIRFETNTDYGFLY